MSTVACSDWILSACWLMVSINPDWVDSRSAVLEYVSSTGRVRNKQPVVGRTVRTRAKGQKGAERLMKYQMTPRTFEYIALERVQNQQTPSLGGEVGSARTRNGPPRVKILLKSGTRAFSHHLNCR